MYSIGRIVVTGDILRPRKSGKGFSQNGNIRWLYNLVKFPISAVCDLPIETLESTGLKDCLTLRIYSACASPVSFDSWVRLYASDPSDLTTAVIADRLQGSLVIGFEMSDFFVKALNLAGIPYLDFTLHPARFLFDILLGVRSNIRGVSESIAEFSVKDDDISYWAGIAMASLGRLPSPAILKSSDGADIGLFAGQTSDDKVLINKGKMLCVDDFLEKLQEISSNHDLVLVKPHPYSPNNMFITALTRLFPNTHLVSDNFYHLISGSEISCVYSLTSSTSIEAGYFGKRGVHLSQYPYVFSEYSATGGCFLTIRASIYTPLFWKKIAALMEIEKPNLKTILNLPEERSALRRSLRAYWGADILENI